MFRVNCHTNLDLHNEQWPTELPAIPRVGDLIESATKHGNFRLRLQVVSVTWEFQDMTGVWIPHIELHMTDFHKLLPSRKEGAANGSIYAFYEWYAPLVGSSVSAFV